MAYIKDDPKNEQQDEVQANVIGPEGAPESQITPSEPSGQPSPGTMSSAGQTAPQGAVRPSSGGSSGRFTDVKSYVEKNRPQAQKIAQKAEKGITSKAAEIGKQAQARKSALQNVLDQNQAQIERDKQAALQQIQDVQVVQPQQMSGLQATQAQSGQRTAGPVTSGGQVQDPQVTQATPEQQASFQDTMKGEFELQAAPELNLAQQELAARRLGQKDVTIPSMLTETFARPGRQYTSGQQRLDQLLLGGTGTGSQLETAAREASEQALGGISDIRRQALADMAAQDLAAKQAGTDVTTALEAARSGILDPVEAKLAEEQAARASLVPQFGALDQEYADRLNQLRDLYAASGDRYSGTRQTKALAQALGERGSIYNYTGGATGEYAGAQLSDQDLRRLGIDPNYYKENVAGLKGTTSDTPYLNFVRDLQSKIQGADPAAVEKALLAEGLTPEQLTQAGDLSLANLASQEDIARYNALQRLAGSEDIIAPETREDYVSAEELQEILNRFK